MEVVALSEVLDAAPSFVPALILGAPTDDTPGTLAASGRVAEEFAAANALGGLIDAALQPFAAYLSSRLAAGATAGTTVASSRAAGAGTAIQGAVNVLDVYDMAAAGVAGGASVNTRGLAGRSADQDVRVDASSTAALLSSAGVDSVLGIPTPAAAAGVDIGGDLVLVLVDIYARALIDDRATVVAARDVVLDAATSVVVNAGASAGSTSADIAVDGAVGVVVLGAETLAAIEDRASVTAGRDVLITSIADDLVVTVVGAELAGAGSTGVGFAAAINVVARPRALEDRTERDADDAPLPGSSVRASIANAEHGMGPLGTGGVTGQVSAAGNVVLRATMAVDRLWAAAQGGTGTAASGSTSVETVNGVGFGFGASVDAAVNILDRRTVAMVRDTTVRTLGELRLAAASAPEVIAASGARVAGAGVGLGGSFSGNWVSGRTLAFTGDASLFAAQIVLTADTRARLISFTDGVARVQGALSIAGSVNLSSTDIATDALVGDRTLASILTTAGVPRGTTSATADSRVDVVSDAGAAPFTADGIAVAGAAIDLARITQGASAMVGSGAQIRAGAVTLNAFTHTDLAQFAAAASVAELQGEPTRLYRNRGPPLNFIDSTTVGEDVGRSDMTTSVALGDLDGDGDTDLVVGNLGQFNRRYLWDAARNGGLGGFDAGEDIGSDIATLFPDLSLDGDQLINSQLADLTVAIALGDVDGDGDLDVVAGNFLQASRVYLNDGTGSFEPGRDLETSGLATSSVTLGDVDADGDLDLVVGILGAPNRLYVNDGTGTFDAGADLTVAGTEDDYSTAVRLVDLDADGILDLVVGNIGLDLSFLVDDGLIALEDVVKDAVVDISDLIASGLVDLVDLVEAGLIDALDFVGLTPVSVADLITSGIADLEDLVRAGLVDLGDFAPTSIDRAPLIASGLVTPAELNDAFGPGGGPITLTDLVNSGIVRLDELVDDGIVAADDLANGALTTPLGDLVSSGAAELRDLIADGLAAVQDLVLTELDVRRLIDSGLATLGQLINDNLIDRGDLDLSNLSLETLRQGLRLGASSKVYLGLGGGAFGPAIPIALAPTQAIDVGDIDGDARPDIVLGNLFADPLVVRNLGGGTFAPPVAIANLNEATRAIALGDLDNDGDLDVVVGNLGGADRQYRWDAGTGAFATTADDRLSTDMRSTSSLAIADLDGDGFRDVVAGSVKPAIAIAGSLVHAVVTTTTTTSIGRSTDGGRRVPGVPAVPTMVDADRDVDLHADDSLAGPPAPASIVDGGLQTVGAAAAVLELHRLTTRGGGGERGRPGGTRQPGRIADAGADRGHLQRPRDGHGDGRSGRRARSGRRQRRALRPRHRRAVDGSRGGAHRPGPADPAGRPGGGGRDGAAAGRGRDPCRCRRRRARHHRGRSPRAAHG